MEFLSRLEETHYGIVVESMDKMRAHKDFLKQNQQKENLKYWALKNKKMVLKPNVQHCNGTKAVLIIPWWSKKQKVCD